MFPIEVLRLRQPVAASQVNIFDASAFDEQLSPATATAYYGLGSSGTGEYYSFGVVNWTWLLLGVNSDYQVRATLVSGTAPSGSATGSWLTLNTSRNWSLTKSGVGTRTCTLTIEIRRVVDSVVIDTATVDITAIVDA